MNTLDSTGARRLLCLATLLVIGCGSTAPGPYPSPWTETSASIDVYCFAFFQGSMRFRATRDQLSASQLQLLSDMQVVNRTGTCFEDAMSCTVAITQASGAVASYDSLDGDGKCASAAMPPVVAFTSLQPFLQTLGCSYAKGPQSGLAGVSMLAPDPRCFNGLFTSGGGTIDAGLVVEGGGVSGHVELDACATADRAGHVAMQLFAPADPTTTLASGTVVADPGRDETCLALDYTFTQPGTYPLTVTADSTFAPGDFYLRYY